MRSGHLGEFLVLLNFSNKNAQSLIKHFAMDTTEMCDTIFLIILLSCQTNFYTVPIFQTGEF